MILHYIEDGYDAGPLLALYSPEVRDLIRFREVANFLAAHAARDCDFSSDNAFTFLGLETAIAGNGSDSGASVAGGSLRWNLSQKNWHLVALLVEPFIDLPESTERFQWLSGVPARDPLPEDGVPVVISRSRTAVW